MATPSRPQPDAIITSEWGGWVHDRVLEGTIDVCTQSTRPVGVKGQLIYETDTGSLLVWTSDTTGWTEPWRLAWGGLNMGTSTAAVSAGSATGAVGVRVFTYFPNRMLRFQASGVMNIVTAGDRFRINLTSGSGDPIGRLSDFTAPTANATLGVSGSVLIESNTLPGGVTGQPYTVNFVLARANGTGTATLDAAPGVPRFTLVEDLGSLGNPPA